MEFQPMKPPDGLVGKMLADGLSAAWEICPNVMRKDDYLYCSLTKERCYVFQAGSECALNPLNTK